MRRMIDEKELKAQIEANALQAGKNINIEGKKINLKIPKPVKLYTKTTRLQVSSGTYAIGDIRGSSVIIDANVSDVNDYSDYFKHPEYAIIYNAYNAPLTDSTSGVVFIPFDWGVEEIRSVPGSSTQISVQMRYKLVCIVGGTASSTIYSKSDIATGGYVGFLPIE